MRVLAAGLLALGCGACFSEPPQPGAHTDASTGVVGTGGTTGDSTGPPGETEASASATSRGEGTVSGAGTTQGESAGASGGEEPDVAPGYGVLRGESGVLATSVLSDEGELTLAGWVEGSNGDARGYMARLDVNRTPTWQLQLFDVGPVVDIVAAPAGVRATGRTENEGFYLIDVASDGEVQTRLAWEPDGFTVLPLALTRVGTTTIVVGEVAYGASTWGWMAAVDGAGGLEWSLRFDDLPRVTDITPLPGGRAVFSADWRSASAGVVGVVGLDGTVEWAVEADSEPGATGQPRRVWVDGEQIVVVGNQGTDVRAMKLAADGTLVWQRVYRDPSRPAVANAGVSVVPAAEPGHLVVIGKLRSTEDFVWWMEIDADGHPVWQRTLRLPAELRDVAPTPSGIAIVGAAVEEEQLAALVVQTTELGEIPGCLPVEDLGLVQVPALLEVVEQTLVASGTIALSPSGEVPSDYPVEIAAGSPTQCPLGG